jgi:acetyl esterase/lipase
VHTTSDFASVAAGVRPVERVAVEVPDAPISHIDVYRPVHSTSAALPMILWVHGGGFISSSAETVADYAILLAASGYVVASLDYTLAPEAHHPVPVRQASAALAYLQDNASAWGGDASSLFIGGDSAGAQIASETAGAQTLPDLAEKDGVARVLRPHTLRGAIFFCGLYDMTTVGATGFPALRTYLWAYTGHRDWLTYPGIDRLSATAHVDSAYPPTFLSVGDTDPFRTQAVEFANALAAADVPVTTLFWDGTGAGLGHEYQFDLTLPQARQALMQTLQFLSSIAQAEAP